MSEEVSAREELYEVAVSYHQADVEEKSAKSIKEDLRGPFMSLMTEVVREEVPLARKTIRVSSYTLNQWYDNDYRLWQQRNYPTWSIDSIDPDEDGASVTLVENPDLKKFEFVHGGYKFGRTVDMGSPVFDVERFYEEQPELRDLVEVETVQVYTLKETKASALMAEKPEVKEIFQEYVEPGKPKLKFLAIRAVQEED